jgi:hypothetical protein
VVWILAEGSSARAGAEERVKNSKGSSGTVFFGNMGIERGGFVFSDGLGLRTAGTCALP